MAVPSCTPEVDSFSDTFGGAENNLGLANLHFCYEMDVLWSRARVRSVAGRSRPVTPPLLSPLVPSASLFVLSYICLILPFHVRFHPQRKSCSVTDGNPPSGKMRYLPSISIDRIGVQKMSRRLSCSDLGRRGAQNGFM